MKDNITVGMLKDLISVTDRISVCDKETLDYENFRLMRDVPDIYDDWFVHGIGMIESEFPEEWIIHPAEREQGLMDNGMVMAKCIEIMVSKEPGSK